MANTLRTYAINAVGVSNEMFDLLSSRIACYCFNDDILLKAFASFVMIMNTEIDAL